MYGPQAAFLSELFGTRVRYSGASLGAQLSSVLAGGLSPFIATALLRLRPVRRLYMIFMAAVTIVAVLVASETHKDDIESSRFLARFACAFRLRGSGFADRSRTESQSPRGYERQNIDIEP